MVSKLISSLGKCYLSFVFLFRLKKNTKGSKVLLNIDFKNIYGTGFWMTGLFKIIGEWTDPLLHLFLKMLEVNSALF